MSGQSTWMSIAAGYVKMASEYPYPCPSSIGPDDRYTLVEVEANTARSWIYRARDEKFADGSHAPTVAVKISKSATTLREGQVGRRIEHRGVVQIIDRGITELGHPYVVMEWVNGKDLSQPNRKLSLRESIQLLARLARIIQAAHSAGVVHCDLKPSNVILADDGLPRLIDFDLADDADESSTTQRGTLAFMAPEQVLGVPGAQTPQADVYALGGLLHYLLYTTAPHGNTSEAIELSHRQGNIPDFTDLPDPLRRIARRAMSPDRAARYSTAYELANDLDAWLDHRPVEWQSPSLWRRSDLVMRRHPALSAVVGVILLACIVGTIARIEWLRRERMRAQEVVTKAGELSIKQIQVDNDKRKELILQQAATLLMQSSKSSGRTETDVMQLLVKLQAIASAETVQDEITGGPISLSLWKLLIDSQIEQGFASDLTCVLARLGYAQTLLSNKQPKEARLQLDIVKGAIPPGLGEEQRLRVHYDVLDACCTINLHAKPTDPLPTREQVDILGQRLTRARLAAPLQELWTAARHQHRAIEKSLKQSP